MGAVGGWLRNVEINKLIKLQSRRTAFLSEFIIPALFWYVKLPLWITPTPMLALCSVALHELQASGVTQGVYY